MLTRDNQEQNIYTVIWDSIQQYHVKPDGTLKKAASVPYLEAGTAWDEQTLAYLTINRLVFRPDGKYLYALIGNRYTQQGMYHGQVAVFRRSATGALAPVPSARLRDLAAPLSLAFTPDGRYAYLLLGGAGDLGNSASLRVYRVGSDGSLKPAPSQPSLNNFGYNNPDTVLVSPNGRYAYVSSNPRLDEYAIQPDGGLKELFSLPGATSYPVCTKDGSLIFALQRMPDTESSPDFSALLMAIKVDALGHLKQTTYLMQADGTLQAGGLPSEDWSKLGFAYVLCPSADGKRLYALNPANHDGIYAYSVNTSEGTLTLTQKIVLPAAPKTSGYPVSMTVISAAK